MAKKRRRYEDDNPEGSGKILGMKPLTLGLIAAGALVAVLVWKRRKDAKAASPQYLPAPGRSSNPYVASPRPGEAATSMATPAQTGAPQGPAMAGHRNGNGVRRPSAIQLETFDDGMGGRLGEFGGGNI